MPSSSWLELGRGWAAVDRPGGHQRLADALNRWRMLGPVGRAALVEFVTEQRQPTPEARQQLVARRFAWCPGGQLTPIYDGAAVVALDAERRRLTAPQASALLAWYRGPEQRVARVYRAFYRNRPHGLHVVFGALERAGLLEQVQGRVHQSRPLGWAVAWMLDDLALLELAGREAS